MLVNPQGEKIVLREAVRSTCGTLTSATKMPGFPPMNLSEDTRLAQLVNDTLDSSVCDAVPFLHRPSLRKILDGLTDLAPRERSQWGQVLTLATSACVLHESYRMS
jgi:hypothetical protein